MKIGLFEMNSGSEINPLVEIGSPIFDKITIHLNNNFYSGKTFEIEVKSNNPENVYIQKAELNGKLQKNQWLLHKDIVSGGKLVLEMGASPNQKWGSVKPAIN
jgi:putative alpha-1,2-mannosidase